MIKGLELMDRFAIAEVVPDEQLAEPSFGGRDMDLRPASCTSFRAVDAVTEIEEGLSVQAIISNLAASEGAFRVSGWGET